MKLNKRLLATVLLVIFFFASCKSKKEANKVFLDFYLGMTEDEYKVIKDSLIKSGKIDYADGRYYTYKFILPDGDEADVRFSPYFDNSFLVSIDLEFGHYGSSYIGNNSIAFYDFEATKDVQSVLQLYSQKYGTPKKDKGGYPDRNGEYKDYDVYKWDKGDFEIVFFPGIIEESSNIGIFGEKSYLNYGGKIEYGLKYDEKEKLNRKKAQDNIKDL
jgi:hypothetical protein